MNQNNAKIIGIEYYLPTQKLTNEELQRLYPEWSTDKIYQKTGVSIRNIADQDECSSDLGIKSAQKLLSKNAVEPKDIDVLIFCTQTPDYSLPSTACIVQNQLGLPTSCAAFDIGLGCSGFVYGLSIASAYIRSGMANNVLLITAETYSKVINPADKSVRTIFGDAGASALISADKGAVQIGDFALGTDGSGYKNLIVPTSGYRIRKSHETSIEETDESGNVRSLDNLYMNGSSIFTFTLDAVPKVVQELLKKTNQTLDDINWFILHQANKFMIQHLIQKMKIPQEKAPICLEEYGNTVSSSIPITIKDCQQKGLFHACDRIMLVGFGVGYSWGATLLEWTGENEDVF